MCDYKTLKLSEKQANLCLKKTVSADRTFPFIPSTESATGAVSPVYSDTDILACILL